MENPVSLTVENICRSWQKVIDSDADIEKVKNLIKFHETITDVDISFSMENSCWQPFNGQGMDKQNYVAIDDEEKLKNFIVAAKTWLYPVQEVKINLNTNRCALSLNRIAVTKALIIQCIQAGSNFGQLMKDPNLRVCFLENTSSIGMANNLSYYRASLVKKTIMKMLEYSQWNVLMNDDDDDQARDGNVLRLEVKSLGSSEKRVGDDNTDANVILVNCGIVTNPLTGKLIDMTTDEYIALRTQNMRLMALHKYGIRFKDSQYFNSLIERLGVAAVTIDLLEKKFSSPLPIIRNGQGNSTKGAAFVLYNSARLETLLRKFDELVQSNAYGPLPPVEEIAFDTVNSEEEWQLVFCFLFKFPNLFKRCFLQIENGQVAVHLLILFLSHFVSAFSIYYRRTKILTEHRQHLMPQIYARIYLLKALRQLLNNILNILDIEPVPNM